MAVNTATALSPSQAARTLGLSRQRVKQLLIGGRLVAERTALGHLIDAQSVEDLRQERAQKLTMARVSQQRTRAHRRHTLAAQRASVIPMPAAPVAKAG